MKKFFRFFVLAAMSAAVPALAVNLPLRIPFQGKLIDPTGNNPKNGDIVMTFRIYDVPTGGSALYAEPMTVAVANGVFAVQIGTSAQLTTNLFSHASAYLGVTVSGDSEMLPRQPLTMSAYAFTAMQLVNHDDIRINAGVTYSTFSKAGNLELQYGVTGTTVTSTAVGAFGVVTSSGISMGAGTLKLAAASRGIDATGTGVVATTATFMTVASTNVGTYGVVTSSGIWMQNGTLTLDATSRGIDATGTGIVASSGTFDAVVLATQAAVVTITATNTLLDVSDTSFVKLTSNNATSTNRIFCLGKARPGHILVLKWDTNAGTNEGQLNDGLSGAGSCTAANSAMPASLVAVWPAATNQPDDTITLIFGGSEWTEISRSAN